jgi:hypothetical protein
MLQNTQGPHGMLTQLNLQTSPPLPDPQHLSSSLGADESPARTKEHALLHATDTDQEPVYNGRCGTGRAEEVSDGTVSVSDECS